MTDPMLSALVGIVIGCVVVFVVAAVFTSLLADIWYLVVDAVLWPFRRIRSSVGGDPTGRETEREDH